MAATAWPATARQTAFLKKLAAERPMWADVENLHPDTIEKLSKKDASAWIDQALKVPAETKTPAPLVPAATTPAHAGRGQWQRASAPAVAQDGLYQNPETMDIYKVQVAKQGSGRLYAKRLDTREAFRGGEYKMIGSFAYEKGAIHRLKPEWRMTVEEAKKYGKLYGFCIVCAADLTDEVSIAEGIGPVCGGRVKGRKIWFEA